MLIGNTTFVTIPAYGSFLAGVIVSVFEVASFVFLPFDIPLFVFFPSLVFLLSLLSDGLSDGSSDGLSDGSSVGLSDGSSVGLSVGFSYGSSTGSSVVEFFIVMSFVISLTFSVS